MAKDNEESNIVYQDEKDENTILPDDSNPYKGELNTSPEIKTVYSGTITFLEKNHAKSSLYTTNEMVVDEDGLVHSGFIYAAADYVASAAVNQQFSIIIAARVGFYAPAKLGDIVEFEANAYFEESKKREIRVVGKIKEMKVFEGTFQLITLEDHIFKVKEKEVKKEAETRKLREKLQPT